MTVRRTIPSDSSSRRRSVSKRSESPGTVASISLKHWGPCSIVLMIAPLQRRPISSTAWWKRGQNRDGSSLLCRAFEDVDFAGLFARPDALDADIYSPFAILLGFFFLFFFVLTFNCLLDNHSRLPL